MDHNTMIAVIEAHRDGKEIQYKDHDEKWLDVIGFGDDRPWDWAWQTYEFRVKPEPQDLYALVRDDGHIGPLTFRDEDDAKLHRDCMDDAERYEVIKHVREDHG